MGRAGTGRHRRSGPVAARGPGDGGGERGYRFSGGEKQRIAIARLLLNGAELRDPQQAQQRIYRELAQEDDPLLREIGEQLRDGVLRPHQLLDIPAYRTVVEQRIELLRRRPADPDAVRAALADYLDSPTVAKPDGGSGQ